ncbi:TPA: formylglycine-generating enzyme family protein [Klebsiella oxytoca]|nr:formylglycine-generating enzyme family protein [Citrobacter freundii]HBM2877346.1 formylglycine-generating enzyme family protein [Klebsiella oxytoca]
MMKKIETKACCTPARGFLSKVKARPVDEFSARKANVTRPEILLPGGRFLMGDSFSEGYPYDGEGPVHAVELSPFSMDITCVSVAEFLRFVQETKYVTEAEYFGYSGVFYKAVMCDESDVIGNYGMPWWLAVKGANWSHPYGPKSDVEALLDHPVVHVSHNDALAYCAWAGRALPTEAQWEYAARGGHESLRFPWGNDLEEEGKFHANVWQGDFPYHNTMQDGWLTTAPVKTYEANDYGLFQMVGNVWEWCSDWFDAKSYTNSAYSNPIGPVHGNKRVMRGGSYLCHHSYCSRYRVAARSSNTPDSSAGNIGFRTVSKAVSQSVIAS